VEELEKRDVYLVISIFRNWKAYEVK